MFVSLSGSIFFISASLTDGAGGTRRPNNGRFNLVTLGKSIAVVSIMTRTNCNVATWITHGIYSTLVPTRILTFIFKTSLMIRTFSIIYTFPSDTSGYRISNVSWMTSTNRSFLVSSIISRLALGICSTRVGFTKIRFRKWSTHHKWIASHVPRARANWGYTTSQLTVGSGATNSVARVFTGVVETGGFTLWAIAMLGAFRLA